VRSVPDDQPQHINYCEVCLVCLPSMKACNLLSVQNLLDGRMKSITFRETFEHDLKQTMRRGRHIQVRLIRHVDLKLDICN
jgi:hypothetical protein